MQHNGRDAGSALLPFIIGVVSTAAFPDGLAVRLSFDRGQVLILPSDDARLVAGGLLDASCEIERRLATRTPERERPVPADFRARVKRAADSGDQIEMELPSHGS
jgi:hypothetical protein